MSKSGRSKVKKNFTEETDVPMTVVPDTKVREERFNSPQRSCNVRLPGYSTPIRSKNYTNDIEDSPELPYRCSPILMPCTQETNEIAWDWHSPSNKSTDKQKNANDQKNVETPKRTKLLQNKRNCNSPLLYKPQKRKLVKLENMENIGKFAAELQALTEKMKAIKQHNTNHVDNIKTDVNKGTELETIKSNTDVNSSTLEGLHHEIQTNGDINDIKKISSDYEDLFDDDINDSMVKCSQEIEARLHLETKNEHETLNLIIGNEDRELLDNGKTSFSISRGSTENSSTSVTSECSPVMHTNNVSKTYSKNLYKENCSTNRLYSKDGSSKKFHFNNNVSNTRNEKSDKTSSSKESSADLFEIPDDSFDDCLALCIEDDKSMLSKSKEYDNIFPDIDDNKDNYGKGYKQSSNHNYSNGRKTTTFVPKTPVLSAQKLRVNQLVNGKVGNYGLSKYNNSTNTSTSKVEAVKVGMENRKFFKTKSLSDQYFGQGKTNDVNVSSNSSFSSKSTVRPQSNSVNSSVSTKTAVTQSRNTLYQGNSSTSKTSSEYACTLNVNRFATGGGGSNIVRHSSLNNISTDVKRPAKGSQPIQCTSEEIERKRLEAKMRLEAKRKLQMNTKVTAASTEALTKRPIKR